MRTPEERLFEITAKLTDIRDLLEDLHGERVFFQKTKKLSGQLIESINSDLRGLYGLTSDEVNKHLAKYLDWLRETQVKIEG
jgi:hypothetical protein